MSTVQSHFAYESNYSNLMSSCLRPTSFLTSLGNCLSS
uniref:Uncharacterized protein n=1 Tax=Rhizophora mucronata TaxID=61149 RepID=A0A2P2J6N3_RHIMU